jgi:hypothetical protein
MRRKTSDSASNSRRVRFGALPLARYLLHIARSGELRVVSSETIRRDSGCVIY